MPKKVTSIKKNVHTDPAVETCASDIAGALVDAQIPPSPTVVSALRFLADEGEQAGFASE